jgi:hypothetical protein
MNAHDDLLQRVRSARPSDPDAAAAEAIAVRTLARFAVLEAGHTAAAARRPRRLRRLVRAAAVLVAVLLPLGALDDARDAAVPTAATVTVEPTWAARVERALAGDLLARVRVVRGGLAARGALLMAAEQHAVAGDEASGRSALELLHEAGPLRNRGEAERVAQLARVAGLQGAACAVLARDMGSTGAEHLGALLAADPRAEAETVRALEQVARRGRREAALEGLLRGVRESRPQAAAAAVRIGGSTHLGRVLAALPEELFRTGAFRTESHVRVCRAMTNALREGSRTLRMRAVRLAERGNARALQLAAAARIPGSVGVLAREAGHEDEARALAAVDLLADVATVPAWVALARALSGPVPERVALHLREAPDAADAALLACARRSLRDAPAAMEALAVRGSVDRLATLAQESRLAPAAIHALGKAGSPDAAAALVALAERPSRSPHVLAALRKRLARGQADAGSALLELARGGHERSVLTALARSGAAGMALLQTAARDPQLGPRARHALLRLRNMPANVRVAGGAPRRTQPSRSI